MDPILSIVAAAIAHRHWLRPMPDVTLDSDLRELGCDQIDRLCIACAVEEEFGIKLPDAVVEGWERVADVVASVTPHGRRNTGGSYG